MNERPGRLHLPHARRGLTYLIGRPVEEYYVHLAPRAAEAVPEERRALIRAVIGQVAAEGQRRDRRARRLVRARRA